MHPDTVSAGPPNGSPRATGASHRQGLRQPEAWSSWLWHAESYKKHHSESRAVITALFGRVGVRSAPGRTRHRVSVSSALTERSGKQLETSSALPGSELVHLGRWRGHASRARSEVRVHGNGSADRDDSAKAVAVVADAVTHGEDLVRRDRIPGGIEGTGRQAASLHGWGHVPIILPLRDFR